MPYKCFKDSRKKTHEVCMQQDPMSCGIACVAMIENIVKHTTAAIDFADLQQARMILDRTHAFMDSNEAEAAGLRVTVPRSETMSFGL